MICFESLKLAGFRNFDDEAVSFVPGTNIILGHNGQGKSNLLEALYLLCTGRSFRTSHLKELIGFDKPGFYLDAVLKKNDISHHIQLELFPNKKKLTIDHTPYSNFHPLMGFLPVVIMTPEMKKIIDSGPLERRKFIDFLGSQLSRPYFESITRYHKALKQRNAALKLKQSCQVWEQLLAKEWVLIHNFRVNLIAALKLHAQTHLSKFPELEAEIQLQFKPSLQSHTPCFESLCDLYKFHRATEYNIGSSLYGPHRDDFDIILNGKLAENTASEGQKKMLIASLCFASFDLLNQQLGTQPLLLIDDYDAHFDLTRKHWICEELKALSQSFLTSPLDELNSDEGTVHIFKGKFDIPLRAALFTS